MDDFRGYLLKVELQKQGERISLLELTAKLRYASPCCALKYIKKFVSDVKIIYDYEREYDNWKREKEEETIVKDIGLSLSSQRQTGEKLKS